MVLFGDAAHTAHFSIGSGTKLAMEDAIALANALAAYPENALVAYELERAPIVERFQQAADESAAYFGRVGNYTNMEPLQFAFNLLTRSRISHGNLSLRDPQFMRALDSWFGGREVSPPPAFSPFGEFPNRFSLVPSGFVAVSEEGRISAETPVIHEWTRPDGAGTASARTCRAGVIACLGRAQSCRLPHGWPIVAPAPMPYGPFSPAPQKTGRGTASWRSSSRPPRWTPTCSSWTWPTATCSGAISRH